MAISERMFDLDYLVAKTRDALSKGSAVLFIGAGASMEGKGPSGKELTEKLKEAFPEARPQIDEFLEVCQEIVDTPPYDLEALRESVKHHLKGVSASNAHLRAARLPWSAIFTTNYDDAIEFAFDHRDCDRRCEVQYLEDRQLVMYKRDTTPVFKLMGCIRRRSNEPGEMVLTQGQYNHLAPERHRALGALYDCLKGGVLIFAGYSFSDRLAFDAMDQLIAGFTADCVPWSYSIGPNPPQDVTGRHRLEKRRIIAIEGTFSAFVEKLWKAVRNDSFLSPTIPAAAELVQLRDCTMSIDPRDLNTRTDSYVLLTDTELAVAHGSQDEFFEGKNVGWIPYKNNWDFQRPAFAAENESHIDLKSHVKTICSERQHHSSHTLLLVGGPGTGKSTLLRRIGYEVYADGLCPVLFLNFHALRVDFGQIDAILQALQTSAGKQIQAGRSLPFLLVIDDAGTQVRQWCKLLSYLASRGHSCTVLAAEREGEWNYVASEIEIKSLVTFRLPPEFSEAERTRIAEHLVRLGYIRVQSSVAADVIRESLRDSLFATFYFFVNPSRIPLDRIINDQYAALPPIQRKAFGITCLLAQFGLTTPFELLVRALKTDFTDFHREVLSGAAAAIIYEDRDVDGRLSYRPHHRIIAEKTVSRFLADEEAQFQLYEALFSNVNLSNPSDWKVMTRLVVDFIGPNSDRSKLRPEHLRALLDILISRGAGRSILHHRGLLEQKEGRFQEAEVYLLRALQDKQRFDESYRAESEQNILTSLGTLYSMWGIELRKCGNTAQSDRLLEEGARCFLQARKGRFGSAHAYHAHANMLKRKAQVDNDAVAVAEYVSEALLILEEAKDHLNEELLLPIRELETELLVRFGDSATASQAAKQLATTYGTSAGYAVWSACALRQLPRRDDAQFGEAANQVIEICKNGLQVNAGDYRILRVLASCFRSLGRDRLEERYDALLRLSGSYPRFAPHVLYELACVAFYLGRYKEAAASFDELRSKCEAQDLRFRARESVTAPDGTRRIFTGYVHFIDEARGEVSCNEFREPYFAIFFNPRYVTSALSRNQRVQFQVYFNMRGPYAREVRAI